MTEERQPTYAYMRDAHGRCWAVCAFIRREGGVIYAWAVRSPEDQDDRSFGRRKALARLKQADTFGWLRRVCRSWGDYHGHPGNANPVMEIIKETSLAMIGRETDIGVLRGALLSIRRKTLAI